MTKALVPLDRPADAALLSRPFDPAFWDRHPAVARYLVDDTRPIDGGAALLIWLSPQAPDLPPASRRRPPRRAPDIRLQGYGAPVPGLTSANGVRQVAQFIDAMGDEPENRAWWVIHFWLAKD